MFNATGSIQRFSQRGVRFRHFELSGSHKFSSKGQSETCMESSVARRQIQTTCRLHAWFLPDIDFWSLRFGDLSLAYQSSIEAAFRNIRTFLHSELVCLRCWNCAEVSHSKTGNLLYVTHVAFRDNSTNSSGHVSLGSGWLNFSSLLQMTLVARLLSRNQWRLAQLLLWDCSYSWQFLYRRRHPDALSHFQIEKEQ